MQKQATLAAVIGAEVAERASSPLPDPVAVEAQRTLFNVLGAMIGASHHPAVRKIVRQGQEHGGAGRVPLPGRGEVLDPYHAALAMGVAGHVDDFDDTHLETVIHPGAASVAAALAAAADHPVPGALFLRAVALGCEAQLRVGAAMSPSHYDAGWHITGTCGVVGAAVSAAVVAGLGPAATTDAVVLAAIQPIGVREAFGTMTKALHAGKAAANGLVAAQLAQLGVTGPPELLEHPAGYFAALADDLDPARITSGWGSHWELLSNTYKPYPCGIVIHPLIDAAIELHGLAADRLASIDAVVVRCHPLVVELTGNPKPTDGLEARFSAIHGVAVGLAFGRAGLAEYADGVVTSEQIRLLRSKIRLVVDDSLARDAARVQLSIGAEDLTADVRHARGSKARPLTDQELLAKVRGLLAPRHGGRELQLHAAVRGLHGEDDLASLLRALRPDREASE